jgi:hypothetical protein
MLNQELHLDAEGGGGGGHVDPISRRRFLKKTGGATVAVLAATAIGTQSSFATGGGSGASGGGSSGSMCKYTDNNPANHGPMYYHEQGRNQTQRWGMQICTRCGWFGPFIEDLPPANP